MRSVRRFLREMVERALGRLAEGPDPPPRIREAVAIFRVHFPDASVQEWMEFAIAHAEESYRSGFIRGLEWSERELERMDPDTPERLADEAANAWSLADSSPTLREMLESGADPDDPLGHLPPEERVEVLDQVGRATGGFRIILEPLEPEQDPDAS